MTEFLNYIKEHYQDILAIIGGIVSAATIIVKLTPTQKDDAVLEKIIKILDYFSVVNPNGTSVTKTDGNK